MWAGVGKSGSPTARLTAPATSWAASYMWRIRDTGTPRARSPAIALRSLMTPPGRPGSRRRDGGDLDQELGPGQPGLDGRPGRRVRLVDPGVPRRVHLVVEALAGDIHRGRQELRLVAAEVGEHGVDLAEDLLGLALGAGGGIVGHLARDVDGIPVLHALAQPRPHTVTGNAHWLILSLDGFRLSQRNHTCSAVPPMMASSSAFDRDVSIRGSRFRLRTYPHPASTWGKSEPHMHRSAPKALTAAST